MCLLTFVPAGKQPDMEALKNGTLLNRNGFGYAIADGDRMIIGKGLEADRVLDDFEDARSRYPDGPALFHSRLTTHGSTSTDNCHPFYVGEDTQTVLAHNGILPRVVQPKKGEWRSDTRITAEFFVPVFVGSLALRTNRAYLQRWITKANKMVILTVNPKYESQAYILNEDEGEWADGIWYSNDGYLRSGWRHTAAYFRSLGYETRGYESPNTSGYATRGGLVRDAGGRYRYVEAADPTTVEPGTSAYYRRWPREWTHCEVCDLPYEECECEVAEVIADLRARRAKQAETDITQFPTTIG